VKWSWSRRLLLNAILSFMILEPPLGAQSTAGLTIQIVKGNGVQNVTSSLAAQMTVRVATLRSNRALSGATVIFTAPSSGPGGIFLNGTNSVIVFTDHDGIAVAPQYRANSLTGTYQLQVRAAYMGDVATASIRQENIAAKKSSHKMIMITAIAGGAAAVALAAKGGSSSQPSSTSSGSTSSGTPTISFAGSSVGAPR
jgi:hypothetical protein